MQDEALQAAFEIKTECDEISRRLLRWHWEQKPGSHSLDALLRHIAQRQKESPDYYDRMPDLSGKTSWQQLDTTLCMRVLLDPEKDAARPLDLLGNMAHPAAARRACNAVRAARNEAAHASDRTAATQAAILFNEAVEALEEGYAGTALRTADLSSYYRTAEDYLTGAGPASPSPRPERKKSRNDPQKPENLLRIIRIVKHPAAQNAPSTAPGTAVQNVPPTAAGTAAQNALPHGPRHVSGRNG